MGDSSDNFRQQNNGSYEGNSRVGMEALMSAALEQQNRNLQQVAASGGYPILATVQDQINALIAANPSLEAEKERMLAIATHQAMFPAYAATGQSHSIGGLPYNFGLQPLPGLLPQTTIPGYSGLAKIPADKVASVHEAGPNGLNYHGLNPLSPFMKIPGYPPMLPGASVPGLLPSMGPLNPASLGALGAYSQYYPGLFTRPPHIPHVDPNALIRMHMNMAVNTPPAQAVTPDSTNSRTESPMRLDKRPLLPVKERVQRRVSAPIQGGNPRFPMPTRNDPSVDLRKSVSPYSMGHRAPLPPQLVAQSANDQKTQSRINNQIIGQRIQNIISQNAKILDSPQLDRVKPRRPTRRNSLDGSTLTPPIRKHPPLTATLSAPRSMDKYSNVGGTHEKIADRQRFLPVPSQQSMPSHVKYASTSIPDTRGAIDNQPNIVAITSMDSPENSNLIHSGNMRNAIVESQIREYHCPECGAKFLKLDNLEAHRKTCFSRRSSITNTRESPNLRQSVIQHTQSKSGDTPPPNPHVVATPAKQYNMLQMDNAPRNPVPDTLRNMHQDLQRTRSADAAIFTKNPVNTSFPIATRDRLTPTMPSSNSGSPRTESPIQKSSIPTNKLPPKKKQLQLMRSNSSNPSSGETSKSPTHDVTAAESSNVTQMATEQPSEFVPLKRKIQPPSSLHLESSTVKKVLPPWIPLDEKTQSTTPVVFVSQSSPTQTSTATLATSPSRRKSPTSPVSPTRRSSPVHGSRSPSRSPTSNLESTIPRSNYRLLLHQISMRNMQDMGYLSEAYRHSKDKDLKRNIAALLCSSSMNDGSGSSKSGKQFPWEVPNMEELYPGKAKLARRLSPNGDLRFQSVNQSNTSKTPLGQSHSRPYESTLEVHPTVTRSHSAGTSSDVNNNIKQYLQNKSRNQQLMQQQKASQGPTKGHKPLTRTNANARYLLKSPTKDPNVTSSDNIATKKPLQMRNSAGSVETSKNVKESLKRASSHSPESSPDLHVKRQKLIPILSQTTTSATILPSSLVTATVPKTSPKKELPRIKSINPRTVQTPFLLHPHVSPNFGYEPHPTFCSLVSPQPMYVELKQSKVSMYSQWAVSEPILPEGMTVMDIFQNTRLVKALSPYISYNSVFTEPQNKLKVTESKDYAKTDQSKEGSTETTSNQNGPIESGLEAKDSNSTEDPLQKWLFSRMVDSHLQTIKSCYTSCHNTVKHSDPSIAKERPTKSSKSSKFPKLCPPKVFVQPPSPESVILDGSNIDSPKSSEMIALEFSDCDSDDDVIKRNCVQHNLSTETSPFQIPTSHCDVTTLPVLLSSNQQASIDLTQDEETEIGSKNSQTNPSIVEEIKPQPAPDEESNKPEVKVQDGDNAMCKNIKKVRKTLERNSSSLKPRKSIDEKASTTNILEDPTLAVHPIGACSDDPAKICALCRMKTGKDDDSGKRSEDENESPCKEELKITADCPHPSSPENCESTSTASPRARTPTPRSKTPVPLTVTVPKRNRDRCGSKSGNQPLTPGILDKARGSGTTQHWVTTTELKSSTPSPKRMESPDDRPIDVLSETDKLSTSPPFDSAECFTANPPNKNPVSELHYQRTSDSSSPPIVMSQNHGSLAAVVSGVMRSAAMQSKKKTKSSKTEMSELLSHSRPLIPSSELNSPTHKPMDAEQNNDSAHIQENLLSSLAMLTSSVGSKSGVKQATRPRRDSSSSKANDSRMQVSNEKKTDLENAKKSEEITDSYDEEDLNCDGTKDDSAEIEGESSNPRPHKCAECKVAFRIAGHLAKHLRSKGHVIAMQKKTLNRLKQQKLSTSQEVSVGGQSSNSVNVPDHSPDSSPSEELLTQLGEAQVRALFEGNDEYAEISTGTDVAAAEFVPEASDEEVDGQAGSSDPRPFKCIACKVAFRFQGHLDRHFRSNTHLLAVGHFERDIPSVSFTNNASENHDEEDMDLNCDADFKSEQDTGHSRNEALLRHNDATDVINDVCESPKPFICLKELNNQSSNTERRSDESPVNQVSVHSDWSKSSKVTKFSVNGLMHNSNVLDVQNPNTLNSTSHKPPTQPTLNQCYEVPPNLKEVPLPSTSPVPKIKQLNCSSPVAI